MKVALVRKAYMHHGGAERYVSTLLNRLVEEGTEVHVFANTWEIDPAISDRVTFHKVPVVHGLSFLEVLSFAVFSRLEIRKKQFDLVHSFDKTLHQDVYRAGDGCHREWLRIRREYCSGWKSLSLRLNPLHITLLGIERVLFKEGHFKKIIATSEMGKREIMFHYHVPPKDIVVIHNGVNHEVFNTIQKFERRQRIRERHGISQDDIIVLFVGSGYERKGLLTLIRATALLKDHQPRVRVVVLGKGRSRPVQRLAKTLGLEDRVHFLGTTSDVADYYVASDIFALPTLYEPFGNVYLEAMASEIPVITSPRSGASELIEDGVNGLILKDPCDVDHLAECILRLSDRTYAQRIAKAGRDRSLTFSEEQNADLIMGVYREVLSRKEEA